MKKTLLLALMAVFATTAVTAQDMEQRDDRRGMDPEKRIEKQVGRLDKKLKLTDEQKQQLKEFYGEFDKAQMARMEQVRLQEKKDREALDGKINSILTEEQKAKYAEMKEKDKEMWKEGRKGFGQGQGHRSGRGHGGFGPGRGHGGHGGHGGFDRDIDN